MPEHLRKEQPVTEVTNPDPDEQMYAELLFEDLAGGDPDESAHRLKLQETNGRQVRYDQGDAEELLVERFLERSGWSIGEVFEHDGSFNSKGQVEGTYEASVQEHLSDSGVDGGETKLMRAKDQDLTIRLHYIIKKEEDRLLFLPTSIETLDGTGLRGERFVQAHGKNEARLNRAYAYRIPEGISARARVVVEAARHEKEQDQQAIERVAQKVAPFREDGWRVSMETYEQDRDLKRIFSWPEGTAEMLVVYLEKNGHRGSKLEGVCYGIHGHVVDIFQYALD